MSEKVTLADLVVALNSEPQEAASTDHVRGSELAAYVWGDYADDPMLVVAIRRHLATCAYCLRAEAALRGEQEGVRVLRFAPRRILNAGLANTETDLRLAAGDDVASGAEGFRSGAVQLRLEDVPGEQLVARVVEGGEPQIGWHVRLVSVGADGAVIADVRAARTDTNGLAQLGPKPVPTTDGRRFCVLVEAPGE